MTNLTALSAWVFIASCFTVVVDWWVLASWFIVWFLIAIVFTGFHIITVVRRCLIGVRRFPVPGKKATLIKILSALINECLKSLLYLFTGRKVVRWRVGTRWHWWRCSGHFEFHICIAWVYWAVVVESFAFIIGVDALCQSIQNLFVCGIRRRWLRARFRIGCKWF